MKLLHLKQVYRRQLQWLFYVFLDQDVFPVAMVFELQRESQLQILQSYDQPSALSVVPVLEDIPQVAESAVIMDAGQIEIDCDTALTDQEQITIA